MELTVAAELDVQGSALRTSYRPRTPAAFALGLERRLADVPLPTVRGPVQLQIRYTINQGGAAGRGR